MLAQLSRVPVKLDCLKIPGVLRLEELNFTTFHLIALFIFFCAVIHTLTIHKIHRKARTMELQKPPHSQRGSGRDLVIQLLYFLSEVEIVFGIWVIPLFLAIACFYNWHIAVEYINTRDYTEALFIIVIMSLASTRPIIQLSETLLKKVAHRCLGGSLSAWWFTLLTVGPILGSFITEVGAMSLSAVLLSRRFYQACPSKQLSYATLGLLFVNISVGGILTNFASPAVLILAKAWHWTSTDMFLTFGWKAVLGILLANLCYWFYFRKEFEYLDSRTVTTTPEEALLIPGWVTLTHSLFILAVVLSSHYPAIFIAVFLFFIGLHHATRVHQYSLKLARPLLVGFFLAGLIIHGGLQGWWVVRLLEDATPHFVMGSAMMLTAFNDNTAIAYLSTLLPNWSDLSKYAIFTGVIAGGGLTVIANAPNPAGFQILRRHFESGISPWGLFRAAFVPTMILYAVFYFFSDLFWGS